jgi:hypothetical protein
LAVNAFGRPALRGNRVRPSGSVLWHAASASSSDADASARIAAAAAWLEARPADAELLVVGPSWEACDDLVRGATTAAGARFGTLRLTLDRLAVRLATPALARDRVAPASAFSLNAVAARAVHLLVADAGSATSRRSPTGPVPARRRAHARRAAHEPRRAGALAKLGPMGRDLSALAECVAESSRAPGSPTGRWSSRRRSPRCGATRRRIPRVCRSCCWISRSRRPSRRR